MKHLKKFEELSPDVYLSAADKLIDMGHKKRPDDLKNWGLISSVKSIGQYEIVIKISGKTIVGDFYIFLEIDKDELKNQMDNWKFSEYGESICIPFEFGLIPVSDELKNSIEGDESHYKGVYYVSRLWINLSESYRYISDSELYKFGIKKPKNVEDLKGRAFPSGRVEFESNNFSNITRHNFTSRSDAVKFRKALIDIFEGNIDYRLTTKNPGGLKEDLMDTLYDEYGLSTDDILRFIDSLKEIKVNQLYND